MMKNIKIALLDAKTLGDDISLNLFNEFGDVKIYQTTTKEQTVQNIGNANIVITNKVVIDKHVLDNTNIKLICVAATGMNNVDLEYAKNKNIIVKNVVGYSSASVTQLTFSIALAFIQKVSFYDNYGKNSWCDSDIFTNISKPFYELEGKTWGIIGFGNIGKRVSVIAEAFGCNIQYYSTSSMNKNTNYNSVDLNTLLSTSNIISVHSPLNKQTDNLINKTNIHMIKDNTILLNLGRGGIVNEYDIATELDKREVYYGTDVVSKEPIEKKSPLLNIVNKDQLIITPHIAWASIESRNKLLSLIKVNINEFIV